LRSEQKGYIIDSAMTSNRDDARNRDDESRIDLSRARLALLLKTPPPPVDSEQTIENRRIWSRASEQQRRRMLKDCGWL